MVPVLCQHVGPASDLVSHSQPQVEVVILAGVQHRIEAANGIETFAAIDHCAMHADRVDAQERCKSVRRYGMIICLSPQLARIDQFIAPIGKCRAGGAAQAIERKRYRIRFQPVVGIEKHEQR